MKNIIILTLIMFVSAYGNSQVNGYEEVIYLKNGSIIRGVIIEQVPGKSYKIETKDRNVFVFKAEEVEKITKEKLEVDNSQGKGESQTQKATTKNDFNFEDVKEDGYFGTIDVGALPYIDYQGTGFTLTTTHGVRLSKKAFLGLGLGIDVYDDAKLPLFVDFRFSPSKSQFTPEFGVNAGYSFAFGDYNYGGFRGGISLGAKYRIDETNSLHFNIGYEYLPDYFYFSSLTVKIGYSF